jgi:circadian clock protein KaiC
MMREPGVASQAPDLLSTGVPNLDLVLGGGIPRGSIVMAIGAPGTGKTMLAQQIAFHLGAQRQSAVYLTGYSETHDKLLLHTRGLSFFREEFIGQQIQLISLAELLEIGPAEAEAAILATARGQHAALVVLDGFRTMRRYIADDLLIGHFLYSLGAKLMLGGATTLVTVEGEPESPTRYPELTICDIILGLHRERQSGRHRRLLDVMKARGAPALDGLHPFSIGEQGITIHPRLESLVPASPPASDPGRTGFGIRDIDRLLGGGLTRGSTTVVAGSPGAGKTLLTIHFAMEGLRHEEPSLLLTFRETADQLRERARTFGLDLAAAEAAGQVRLLALSDYELEADRVANLLREDLEHRGVRRLVIDSAAELERGIAPEDRKPEFLAALATYTRGRGVTTCITLDVPKTVGQDLDLVGTPFSVLAENLLLLRDVEYLGQPHRVFSVLKMGFSGYERSIREYEMVPGHGIQVLGVAPATAGQPTESADRPLGQG